MDDEDPLYRNDADSNCKYPIFVPEKGLCLSLKEVDFVYTCIEHDNIVTPFEMLSYPVLLCTPLALTLMTTSRLTNVRPLHLTC